MKYIDSTYKININNIGAKNIKEIMSMFNFYRYGDEYIHRFPVYRYKNKSLVWCYFIIYEDDISKMHINVLDINYNSCNYNKDEYGNSLVTEIINKRIYEELDYLTKEEFLLIS